MEYVLGRAGVVFQWDDTVTSVSYLSREVDIDGKTYRFRKINPEIWVGMEGVEQRGNVAMATPEKAFLDIVYLSAGNCYFDNLRPLSIKKINELLPFFNSPTLNERVREMFNKCKYYIHNYMASTKDYADFILEQLSGLDEITARKMMGEYILYFRDKIIGGVYDNRFLVKPTKSAQEKMPDASLELPYEGAKPMLLVDNVENRDFLKELVLAMYEELPESNKKRK